MSAIAVSASLSAIDSENGSLNVRDVRDVDHLSHTLIQKRAKKAKDQENGNNNGDGQGGEGADAGSKDKLNVNPTQAGLPVKGAKGKLKPDSAAEANPPESGTKKAFTAVQLKSGGKCLFVDPLAGNFRQNLIPARMAECDGTKSQKFNLETTGKHIKDKTGENALIRSVLVRYFQRSHL